MKRTLLTIATVITTCTVVISIYLATLPNPTDTQKQLSNTTNTIAITGATSIFGLLDDDNRDSDRKTLNRLGKDNSLKRKQSK